MLILVTDDADSEVIVRSHNGSEVAEAKVDSVYSEARGDGPFRIIVEGDGRWNKP